jgi:hypothetical protein
MDFGSIAAVYARPVFCPATLILNCFKKYADEMRLIGYFQHVPATAHPAYFTLIQYDIYLGQPRMSRKSLSCYFR